MIRNRSPRARDNRVDDSGASRARILIVDADDTRAQGFRQAIEVAGFPEPERATSGDDALDLLGAAAQCFDIVAAWVPLVDHATVDVFGILRRCRSPVWLIAITDLSPRDYPAPRRLAGVCAIEGRSGERGVIQCLRQVQRQGTSAGDIAAGLIVPPTLDQAWAVAVYDALPGSPITVPLD